MAATNKVELAEELRKQLTTVLEAESYAVLHRHISKADGKGFEDLATVLKNLFALLSSSNAEIRKLSLQFVTEKQDIFVAFQDIVAPILRDIVTKKLKNDMIKLLNCKEEAYVIKLWEILIILLGKALHKGSSLVNTLLEVIEKGLKSRESEIVVASMNAWKQLIRNFTPDALLTPNRLKLLRKPMNMVQNRSQEILLAKCDTMWFLASALDKKLIDNFEGLLITLLKLAFSIQGTDESLKSFITRAALSNVAPLDDIQMKGCEFLIRILEQVTTSNDASHEAPTPNILISSLQAAIPRNVIRKHGVFILKASKEALKYLCYKDYAVLIHLLLRLLMEKLNLMRLSDVKEDIEMTVLFLQIVHALLKDGIISTSINLNVLGQVVAKMPAAILCSPRYQLDCRDMTSGVPAITFLRLLLSTTFVNPALNERVVTIFKKLASSASGETATTVIELSVEFLQNPANLAQLKTEMWCSVAQLLSKCLKNKNGFENDSFPKLVQDLLCIPLPIIVANNLKAHRASVVKLWTEVYKAYCDTAGEDDSRSGILSDTCQKLLHLCSPDHLLEPLVLNDIISLLTALTETVKIPGNNGLLSGTSPLASKKVKGLGTLSTYVDLLVEVLKSLSLLWSKNTVSGKKIANLVPMTTWSFNLVMLFMGKISSSTMLVDVLEKLVAVFVQFYSGPLKNKQIEKKLENMLQDVNEKINSNVTGTCGTELLVQISPLLASTLVHSSKSIRDKSRQMFLRLFGNNYGILSKCQSLKKVLREIKPSLVPNLDVDLEGDISSLSNSSPEVIPIMSPSKRQRGVLSRPAEDVAPSKKPHLAPAIKPIAALSVEEMDERDFVTIVPSKKPNTTLLTERQKETLKKKSFLPSMYNDLSQQSQLSNSSQPSQSEESDDTVPIVNYAHVSPDAENISQSVEIIEHISKDVQDVITLSSSERESVDCGSNGLVKISSNDDQSAIGCEDNGFSSSESSGDTTTLTVALPGCSIYENVVVPISVKRDAKINTKPVLELDKLTDEEMENLEVSAAIGPTTAKIRLEKKAKTRKKALPIFLKLSRASLGDIGNIPSDEDIIPSSISSLEETVASQNKSDGNSKKPRRSVVTRSRTVSEEEKFFSCSSTDAESLGSTPESVPETPLSDASTSNNTKVHESVENKGANLKPTIKNKKDIPMASERSLRSKKTVSCLALARGKKSKEPARQVAQEQSKLHKRHSSQTDQIEECFDSQTSADYLLQNDACSASSANSTTLILEEKRGKRSKALVPKKKRVKTGRYLPEPENKSSKNVTPQLESASNEEYHEVSLVSVNSQEEENMSEGVRPSNDLVQGGELLFNSTNLATTTSPLTKGENDTVSTSTAVVSPQSGTTENAPPMPHISNTECDAEKSVLTENSSFDSDFESAALVIESIVEKVAGSDALASALLENANSKDVFQADTEDITNVPENNDPSINSKETDGSESSTERLLTEMGFASQKPSNEITELLHVPLLADQVPICQTEEPQQVCPVITVESSCGTVSVSDSDGALEKNSGLSEGGVISNLPQILEPEICFESCSSSAELVLPPSENEDTLNITVIVLASGSSNQGPETVSVDILEDVVEQRNSVLPEDDSSVVGIANSCDAGQESVIMVEGNGTDFVFVQETPAECEEQNQAVATLEYLMNVLEDSEVAQDGPCTDLIEENSLTENSACNFETNDQGTATEMEQPTHSEGSLRITIKVPKEAMANVLLPTETGHRKHRRKSSSPSRSPISTRLRANRRSLEADEMRAYKPSSKRNKSKKSKKEEDCEKDAFSPVWKNVTDIGENGPANKLSPMRLRFVENSKTSPLSRSQMILQASIRKGNSPQAQEKILESNAIKSASSTSFTGILKQRKDNNLDDNTCIVTTPSKKRKVSFSDPLVQCFEKSLEMSVTVKASRCLELSSEVKSQEDSLTPSPALSDVCGDFSQESDNSSQQPVFLQLVDCQDPIASILSSLTSSLWSKGLEQLLRSRNITTVGHLSSMTLPEVKSLPLIAPKLLTLRSALRKHLMLQKKLTSLPEEMDECNFQTVDVATRILPLASEEHVSPSESGDDEPMPSVEAVLLDLDLMEIETELQEQDEVFTTKPSSEAVPKECELENVMNADPSHTTNCDDVFDDPTNSIISVAEPSNNGEMQNELVALPPVTKELSTTESSTVDELSTVPPVTNELSTTESSTADEMSPTEPHKTNTAVNDSVFSDQPQCEDVPTEQNQESGTSENNVPIVEQFNENCIQDEDLLRETMLKLNSVDNLRKVDRKTRFTLMRNLLHVMESESE